MRKTAPEPLPLLVLAISAAAALTSCGSNSSVASSTDPPPVTQTLHVAVADSGDNRVLIFSTPLSADASAGTVIGQTSFTQRLANQGAANPTAASLDGPMGLAMDSAGNLWVADNNNCRVLEFQPPFTTGMSASLVIGQSNFDTSGPRTGPYCEANLTPPISAANIRPAGVAFDSQGDLWVVSGEVTEYVPPFQSGMAPSAVIGAPNLDTLASCNGTSSGEHGPILPPTAGTLCGPEAIAFDAHGNLWVTDQGNLRVLEFVPPFTTGMSASLVLGQPTMTVFTGGATCFASATNFCRPDGLAFDGNGDLWVSDWTYARVLEFVPPFTSGMAASVVVGQPNFTGLSASATVRYPNGLTFDGEGNLIALNDAGNDIVVFAPPFTNGMSPTAAGTPVCSQTGPTANAICGAILGALAF
ncbi:MAG TPA: NHL repeat-containing protein [Terracidiphilus sp.]|jgi:sugar lactone lactonase YvrE|nr:NHL repeat-containing protein [Terracidiphilus sp.]